MQRRKRHISRHYVYIIAASLILILFVGLWVYGAMFTSSYNEHLSRQDVMVNEYARMRGMTGFVAGKLNEHNLSRTLSSGLVRDMGNYVAYNRMFANVSTLIHNCSFVTSQCSVSRGENVTDLLDPEAGDVMLRSQNDNEEGVLIHVRPPSDEVLAEWCRENGMDSSVSEALVHESRNITVLEGLLRLFKGDFDTGTIERFRELQEHDHFGLNVSRARTVRLD